jgi:dihydroorotate dehydrogenase electron transfer subunit
MSKILNEEILKNEELAPSIYRIVIKSNYTAASARPGQFLNIKCGDGNDALLRRPISICSVDRNKGTLDIVFQKKGTGTAILSQKKCGDCVNFIGPLGNAFELSDEHQRVAVVGGGIGVFPLLYLLEEKLGTKKTAFLGFRSKNYIVLEDEFRNAADNVYISTDDGSYGHEGLITDLLEKHLENNVVDIIYTCGPTPMIKTVSDIARERAIKCQVSLEQRMGCGIGACLVCACKTKFGEEWEYSHVCKDGPVFWSDEVIFDD